jgi:hypothetical protein
MLAVLIAVTGVTTSSTPSTATGSSTTSARQLTIYQLRTGDCLQDSDIGNLNELKDTFTEAPCTQPHAAEVFFAGNDWPRSLAYPGDTAVYDDGYARCLMALSAYDGIDGSLSALGVEPSVPDSSTWLAGDRRLVCFALVDGQARSIRGSHQ